MTYGTVILTAEQTFCAVNVAAIQMVRKVANNRNNDHGGNSGRPMKQRWADTIHGLMCEVACCDILRVPWTPGGSTISYGDMDRRLEARGTDYEDGHLMIYTNDDDDRLVFLMIGTYPQFSLAGYIRAGDGKKEELWRNGNLPCWWVPQAMLLNPLELKVA